MLPVLPTRYFSSCTVIIKKNGNQSLLGTLSVIKRDIPVTVTVSDHEQHTVTVEGDIPQQAIHRPIDEARCLEQLKRQGEPLLLHKRHLLYRT